MPEPMILGPVGNVFYFVADLDAAVRWYGERLGRMPVVSGGALAASDVGGVRLTLHKVDELNAAGPPAPALGGGSQAS